MKKIFKSKIFWLLAVVLVVAIIWLLNPANPLDKVETVTVTKGDLLQVVSVTGRVKPIDKAELSFNRSGLTVAVPAQVGQHLRPGQIIAQLDADSAKLAVKDAELALANARLDLDKLKSGVATKVTTGKLETAYQSGLAASAEVYTDLGDIIDALDDIYFDDDLVNGNSWDSNLEYYANTIKYYSSAYLGLPAQAKINYNQLKEQYQTVFGDYTAVSQGGNDQLREEAILGTYDLLTKTANLVKSGRDLIRVFKDRMLLDDWAPDRLTLINQDFSDLSAYQVTINNHLLDLADSVNEINNYKDQVANESLDIEAQQLVIAQKENDLARAKDDLSDYYLLAPFAGTVTSLDLEVGERVLGGAGVATLQSDQKLEIEANVPEADIAKLQVGNTGLTTLDAYGDDLKFAVILKKIDPAETLIEGVPTYRITLEFVDLDSRIKPGMTANIDLTTASKEQVFAIPARAVITTSGHKTVRVVVNKQIENREVITGLRGSDGTVEIISGLKAGERVVVYAPDQVK